MYVPSGSVSFTSFIRSVTNLWLHYWHFQAGYSIPVLVRPGRVTRSGQQSLAPYFSQGWIREALHPLLVYVSYSQIQCLCAGRYNWERVLQPTTKKPIKLRDTISSSEGNMVPSEATAASVKCLIEAGAIYFQSGRIWLTDNKETDHEQQCFSEEQEKNNLPQSWSHHSYCVSFCNTVVDQSKFFIFILSTVFM